MNPSLSKRAINRQHWRERVTAWKSSNQSQKAFCQDHHLGLGAFQRWQRIFKAEVAASVPSHPAPVGFLPVNVRQARCLNLTIRIQDDLRIEVPAGFNPQLLQQVIQVLRTA